PVAQEGRRRGARAARREPPLPRSLPAHRTPARRARRGAEPGDARGNGHAVGGGEGGARPRRQTGRTCVMTESNPSRQAALFLQLVLGLQQSGMMALGKLMNPLSRKIETNLEMARDTIDTLAALEARTKG